MALLCSATCRAESPLDDSRAKARRLRGKILAPRRALGRRCARLDRARRRLPLGLLARRRRDRVFDAPVHQPSQRPGAARRPAEQAGSSPCGLAASASAHSRSASPLAPSSRSALLRCWSRGDVACSRRCLHLRHAAPQTGGMTPLCARRWPVGPAGFGGTRQGCGPETARPFANNPTIPTSPPPPQRESPHSQVTERWPLLREKKVSLIRGVGVSPPAHYTCNPSSPSATQRFLGDREVRRAHASPTTGARAPQLRPTRHTLAR